MHRSLLSTFLMALLGAGLLATAGRAQAPRAGALGTHHPEVASLLDAVERIPARIHRELAATGGGMADAEGRPSATAADRETSRELDRRLYDRLVEELLPGGALRAGSGPSDEAVESASPGLELPSAVHRVRNLRRRILDLLAGSGDVERGVGVESAVDRYLESGGNGAVPAAPKDVRQLREEPGVGAFADAHPHSSALLRACRWLQLAVHEVLIEYDTPAGRRSGMLAVTARFWQMLDEPSAAAPRTLPLAPAVAPGLVREHPRAAAIYDNLHLLYEVVADARVARRDGDPGPSGELVERFLDPAFPTASWYDWNRTAIVRGVGNQGGWATGFLPRPERSGMDHGQHEDHVVIPGMPPGGR